MPSVPVIDLAASAAEAAIGDACRDWGFFQVVGHDIPSPLCERFVRELRRFFALPPEAKRAVERDADNAWGYYDRELTKNVRDWKEVFDFGGEAPSHRKIDGASRWPAELPGFREVMVEYYDACESLGLSLLSTICTSLGLPADALAASFRPDHSSFLRLNHYPACTDPAPADAPDAPARGHLGVGRHSDAGALTLVLESGATGLQVKHAGRWLTIDSVPGAQIVNLGDMLQVWSNDRYRAPLHRVVARADRERFSAPFFLNPGYDTDCAPLAPLVDAEHPARYRAVNWGDFRRGRTAGDYADLGEEIQIERFRV